MNFIWIILARFPWKCVTPELAPWRTFAACSFDGKLPGQVTTVTKGETPRSNCMGHHGTVCCDHTLFRNVSDSIDFIWFHLISFVSSLHLKFETSQLLIHGLRPKAVVAGRCQDTIYCIPLNPHGAATGHGWLQCPTTSVGASEEVEFNCVRVVSDCGSASCQAGGNGNPGSIWDDVAKFFAKSWDWRNSPADWKITHQSWFFEIIHMLSFFQTCV